MGKKSCEIILGTYEEFVLGFKYDKKVEELTQSFALHSHVASVRCVAHSNRYVASGGADDKIVVYDLQTRKEHCLLPHHNSTVNCLQFTINSSHIISGSQDGTLAIVRIGNWIVEKVWPKAHNGQAILDIAVHPTSKLALTLGADGSLRTWNLIKGRMAFVINLNSKYKDARSLFGIRWSEDGVRFVIAGSKNTDIWSIETGGLLKAIEHERKVVCCIWENAERIVVGYEDGHVGIVSVESGEIGVHEAHKSRVKCLTSFSKRIITGSSEGELKVFNANMKELCKHNAGCRFTSITCVPLIIKKVHEENEESEETAEPVVEISDSPIKLSKRRVVIEEEVTEVKKTKKKVKF